MIVGFVRPSELSRHIDKKHGPQHIPPDLRHYIKAPVEKSIRGVSLNFPIHIKKTVEIIVNTDTPRNWSYKVYKDMNLLQLSIQL